MPAYPLDFPAIVPSAARIAPVDTVGVSASPFTGQVQVQAHQGQQWRVDLDFPPLTRAQAQLLRAFRLALRGRYGTFLWSPASEGTPLGPLGGTPVIDGAGQTGADLETRGWTYPAGSILFSSTSVYWDSTTVTFGDYFPVLLAGDWVQIGTGLAARLHQLTADAHIDDGPAGGATLSLWPAVTLGQAVTDGQAIVTASPAGVFRLAANDDGWDLAPGAVYGMSLSLISDP